MNPLRVRAGRLALALGFVAATIVPARAQTPPPALSANDFWFGGTRMGFEYPQLRDGQFAVATDDKGLARLLTKTGATLSYQPGQNVIAVTTADHRLITFTLGDPHLTIAGVTQAAAFAPYASGSGAYVPLLDLARALYVDPVQDGATTVMEPQIAALDVRPQAHSTIVTLHGATPLTFKRTSDADDYEVSLAFSGTASTLETLRQVEGPGLHSISITVDGSARNPTTIVTFAAAPGGVHALAQSDSPNSLTLVFAPAGVALGGTPIPAAGRSNVAFASAAPDEAAIAAAPRPAPVVPAPALPPYGDQTAANANPDTSITAAPAETPTPTAFGLAPATISAVDTQNGGGGLYVRLTITGNVTYEWHRLSDNRWYIDLKPATLTVPSMEQPLDDPSLLSLRVKPFTGPNDGLATVRVGLTLPSPRSVSLVPTPTGMMLEIGAQDDTGTQVTGTGELLPGRLYSGIVPLPPIQAPADLTGADQTWKFGGSVPTNPKLIVIDPGHGGSDAGAEHNGLIEKDLNLDISKRLQAVLVSRGWQVKMTRETDIDVFAPNDSARDELQARDDVANKAGGRMFVSVHSNSFTTSALNGTTTYYYKADSYALAEDVHSRLAGVLPTQDDGVRKDNFYVIHHASMPAILVETAFLSNPGDAALLKQSSFLQKIAVAIADGIEDFAANSQPLSDTTTTGGI
jgi:N-acetylmuramoyl-L-alanine amidase CwlD